MKSKIYLLILMGALFAINGCQTPDELLPPVAHSGLNSVTAYFTDAAGNYLDQDKGRFTVTVTEGNTNIVIPVPYYFPEESDNPVTAAMLSRMRMRANLDDNVTVAPPLLYMDLTQPSVITVTTQRKEKVQYTISSLILKSSACVIEEFTLPLAGDAILTGIITESTKTISLIASEPIAPCTATIKLSPHATISPDPRTTTLDYNNTQTFVVTAHDGTSATYTTSKSVPAKLPAGIRPGSEKLLFAKLISALGTATGVGVANNVNGLAATLNHIVLSTRGNSSIVIDAKTGDLIGTGTVDVSITGGGLNNFYTTADDGGNIFICNLVNNRTSGAFKIYKQTSATATPEVYISCTLPGDGGRKMSVQGNIATNAIITVPFKNADVADKFARWQVINGTLVSQTPDIVTVTGMHWHNGSTANVYNVDLVATSDVDLNADYFIARYGQGTQAKPNPVAGQSDIYSLLDWMNGSTNAVRATLVDVNQNFVANAVDYTVFNNTPYVLVNYVNAYNWGQADRAYLVNAASTGAFTAAFNAYGGPGVDGAIEWACPLNTYGAQAAGTTNGNSSGDVAFVQSADGNFLYVYFMFANGYVVGYQFDCFDI
ncbi:MAG: DUF5018 domain-containing protein [Prevotellaceae bacterium]|jgi:hypothetical protein|nr:DUF5018 domain-containing protein [Prevotellaceae bacterium]